ncbi:LOW QUALITY PROTEIN: transcription factor EMB1444-like [Primulina eburnea]|uniref:LOW QUALITY PROTEIN: transcription factor EMB1444-like n=1 Tax=Primulina eburnea TaxID=1245227 RepID=UPI003C6C724A
MESQLQQMLRSLCFNTGWKYAIFWKLKHQEQMILTWEDAYYDGNLYPDKKYFIEAAHSLNYGLYSHDLLGLAVAKMSYQVYSLGEGIVGQVAVSGKHSWIYSDKHVAEFSSTSETFDGWQNQFSAGIKTIAVVAVIPHGVVQLGCLHKISEDLKLIKHIRNVFSDLQDSLAGGIHSSLHNTLENSCLSDACARIPNSAGNHDHKMILGSSFYDDGASLCCQFLSSIGSNHASISPLSGGSLTLKMKKHERSECSMPENEISLPSSSESILTRKKRQEAMGSFCEIKCGEETNDLKDLGERPEILSLPAVKNVKGDNLYLYDTTIPTDGHQMNLSCLPLENLDSLTFQDQSEFYVPETPSEQLHPSFERNLEIESKFDNFEMHLSPFRFSYGYELYEALGPSFRKQNGYVWEEGKKNSDMAIENPEEMGSSSLLMENPDMHLLDALVAKVSGKDDDANIAKSCQETEESLFSAERTPCTSVGTIRSTCYSFDRATSSSLNSVPCGVESLKGLLSPSSSRGSGLLERLREPVKMNKKRTRTGENSRPRPRDRQLIQDRIKELRELVPSGSKCSIDSLLEQTIKHMLFLQSITKHAEKLHKCSASKLLDKNTDMWRFSSEQGSSWAMEVGNNSKVFPIIVENINMHGQMLVEMLCERCSQFLDIAETIRSLGLTILKGVSEAYGNKTWICFVVEGQNNKSMHRMDVLWSLMQILQTKISS